MSGYKGGDGGINGHIATDGRQSLAGANRAAWVIAHDRKRGLLLRSAQQGSLVQFSTDAFPEKDRVEAWREIYARTILKVEALPHKGQAFGSALKLRSLPNLGVGFGYTTPATYQRTRALTQSNEFLLLVFRDAPGTAIQGKREAGLAIGEATLLSGAEMGASIHPTLSRYISFALPHDCLIPLVPDAESLLGRRISANNEALRLLVGYLDRIKQADLLLSFGVEQLASSHAYDLVALALGATRDAYHVAQNRGVRAARLRAIKDDVFANCSSRELNVNVVAGRQGISTRYIRSLFEGEATSFTDYLMEVRLAQAHRLLVADRLEMRAISSIAFAVGFTDVPHFNRAFRRRYGATPSDIRQQARLGGKAGD